MRYFLATLLILFLTSPALAEDILEPKEKGMNVLVVKEAEEKTPEIVQEEEKEDEVEIKETIPETNHPLNLQSTKALTPKEALIPQKDLEKWPYLNEIKSGSDTRVQKALDAIETDLSKVPPTALFHAAEAYFERGKKEKGAIVYYLAQLRARFDFRRWPVLGNGIDRPQNDMTGLSLSIGEKISPWVLSDTKRMSHIFDLVEETDLAVPYAYLPTYKLPVKGKPEDTWPELLKEARDEYFTKTHALRKALSAVKR